MVAPISGVGAAVTGAPLVTARPPAAPAAGEGFGQLVERGLQGVSNLEHHADGLAQQLATGGSARIEDVMIATTQAQLGIELLSRVRDRALEAYQEVMRLPM